jgi:hypothetical protein
MSKISRGRAPLLTAVCFFAFGFVAMAPAGRASVYYLDCNSSGVCGSPSSAFGTVTVTQVHDTGANEYTDTITVNLGSNTFEGASDPAFLFNLGSGVSNVSITGLPTNWTSSTSPDTLSSALGTFSDTINNCSSCKPSTLTFSVTGTTLNPSDFLNPNTKGFVFAAGVSSSGSSAYYAAAPEPSSYALLIGMSLAGLLVLRNRCRTLGQEASSKPD